MRVVEETWGSVYGNLINRKEDGEVWRRDERL
jgi:hypothetical protein